MGEDEVRVRMPVAARLFGVLLLVVGAGCGTAVYLSGRSFDDGTPWWVQVPVIGLFFVGGPWMASAYLISTRVVTDEEGLLIVTGGLRRRKIPWTEIAGFGICRVGIDGGPLGPRDPNGVGPFIWVFCRGLDPANPYASLKLGLCRRGPWRHVPPAWDTFSIPFQWVPGPGRRTMRDLIELRDRLEVLLRARGSTEPLPAPLADFLARLPSPAGWPPSDRHAGTGARS